MLQLNSKNTTQLKMEEDLNRYLYEEAIQLASKHMKRCAYHLVTREMQMKITMRYHFISTRMAVIKETDNNKY